jgi:hypothetical protein
VYFRGEDIRGAQLLQKLKIEKSYNIKSGLLLEEMASLEKNAAGLQMATLPQAAGPMQEMTWECPLL